MREVDDLHNKPKRGRSVLWPVQSWSSKTLLPRSTKGHGTVALEAVRHKTIFFACLRPTPRTNLHILVLAVARVAAVPRNFSST